MKTLLLSIAAAVVVVGSLPPAATAAEKRPAALVSAPLSINPNDGQPLCLATNVSAATTVPVTVEIIDAMGTVATVSASIPPGGVEAASDAFANFYSYCRITPQDATHLPLLRGSHCVATAATVRTCIDAR
jgi:hypothetical protein